MTERQRSTIVVIAWIIIFILGGMINGHANSITCYDADGNVVGITNFDYDAVTLSPGIDIEYVRPTVGGYLLIGLHGSVGDSITCRAMDSDGQRVIAIERVTMRSRYQEMIISNAGHAVSASCFVN